MRLGSTASRPSRSGISRRFIAALLFAIGCGCAAYWRPAEGLPSYARQTGQECAACHNGFPELTPYGRLFKLNGYTFSGGDKDWPALAAMAIPSFTHTSAGQPGGAAPGFGTNDNISFTGSLFYGGKIFDDLGAFAQFTYDQVPNQVHWDNLDIRYAKTTSLFGEELVDGISLNNNPTVEDVWNSTPAWGYPYLASQLAPRPGASTLIEGQLAQRVLGLTPYVYWNRLIYAEVGAYRTLGPWSLSAVGISPGGTNAIDGVAPSWRVAIEPQWGNNTWEFGTFGMSASLVPQRVTGSGTDRLTDIGVDTQYQFLGARDSFSVQARYIYEDQDLSASQRLGFAANSHNHLNSFNIKGSYYYKQTVGFTTGYFHIDGSPDPLLYGGVSADNSPNSTGYVFELDYIPFNNGGPSFWPWLNMKLGVQFVHYTKFNGASTNFDGAGRNARDNDTLFAFAWLAF
jgi:hypothetical protein